MAEDPESYQYSPIIGDDGIRLIQLQPSKGRNSIVQCELIHTRLRTIKQDLFEHYTALSYVWGDATQTTQIMVGKRTLEVTKSLDSALRHLRDEMRVLNVWADGVCINQKDETGEKGRQVQQMGKVYETADHTVIFLGGCTAKNEETLSDVVASCEENTEDRRPIIDQNGRSFLQDLLGRPWFRRVWVYQELVKSRDPWVQCGHVRFPWRLFCQFTFELAGDDGRMNRSRLEDKASLIQNSNENIVENMERARSRFMTAKLRSYRDLQQSQSRHRSDPRNDASTNSICSAFAQHAGYTKLFEILVLRRGFGASDARDLVFSAIGLCENIEIYANYSMTITDVYHGVAWECIYSFRSLELLSHIQDTDPIERTEGLASWAPDWTAAHMPERRIPISLVPWTTPTGISC